ncbi:phospholipase, patatin family protein [Myriangium duriaei CBS 260.36]|uniref:Phospholipase, patatin family protein n=1 Tax=Myriangium duriaei CBS 260.36 TaxID=1168546 RepID=A0A9P4MFJ0_9PEZI|nr:phospholipase, patatin family protein [Myriangium duriaei CBS 260.36]
MTSQFKKLKSGKTQTTGGCGSSNKRGKCILSIDGGGVRGLSALMTLKSIMDRLNRRLKASGTYTVKPCEVFDLIGGTNTGGLIAIMLGRLQMTVDECIQAYGKLSESVFRKPLHDNYVDLDGRIQAKFDSRRLGKEIAEIITSHGVPEDALFASDSEDRRCRTFVCAMDKDTSCMVRLRDYYLSDELSMVEPTIKEAALATFAATRFFEPVQIARRMFTDATLGANNPVDQVEGEANNIWRHEGKDLKALVKCFISIGTGNPGLQPVEDVYSSFLGGTLNAISSETEKTEKLFVERWAGHLEGKRYFRFNVEQGLQNVGIAEYKGIGLIEAATENYLVHQKQKLCVRDCIKNLEEKEMHYIDEHKLYA